MSVGCLSHRKNRRETTPYVRQIINITKDLGIATTTSDGKHPDICLLNTTAQESVQNLRQSMLGKTGAVILDGRTVMHGQVHHSARPQDPFEFQYPGIGQIRYVGEH